MCSEEYHTRGLSTERLCLQQFGCLSVDILPPLVISKNQNQTGTDPWDNLPIFGCCISKLGIRERINDYGKPKVESTLNNFFFRWEFCHAVVRL